MPLIHKVFPQRLRYWVILAVLLLVVIAFVSPAQLSVTIYKLSLVSIAVVLGYHLDRALFPYASPGSYLIDDWKKTIGKPLPGVGGRNEPEYPIATGYELVFAAVLLRRAVIVLAVVLGVTLGL
ncbi:putative holin [Candidatus Symbiopectobacterium sp. NZEC135]|uniref:putative holin n=1 Tax=Candidatus Symbiopectobacterium sp. NZEC135 TaxID=2820471 RepID=UPI00222661D4|nr:putative holin [Candidatus Symbiopectobacterium sp. NZEC135]MCW2478849.1 putative holin [Candidatus Symbiopectobacterium sp. NZEC135]